MQNRGIIETTPTMCWGMWNKMQTSQSSSRATPWSITAAVAKPRTAMFLEFLASMMIMSMIIKRNKWLESQRNKIMCNADRCMHWYCENAISPRHAMEGIKCVQNSQPVIATRVAASLFCCVVSSLFFRIGAMTILPSLGMIPATTFSHELAPVGSVRFIFCLAHVGRSLRVLF